MIARDDLSAWEADLRLRDPERRLAMLWAPKSTRPLLLALSAYDLEQARIVRDVRDAMLAEIRMAWWREQLLALAAGADAPAQPILKALAAVRDAGVDLAAFARIEDGHLPLLFDGPPDALAMARARGAALFEAMAAVLGDGRPVAAAGTWWAAARLQREQGLAVDPAQLPDAGQDLPPPMAGLLALARADCDSAGRGAPLPPEGTATRQWRFTRAAWRARG